MFLDSLLRPVRLRKREQALAQAAGWPLFSARTLGSTVVPKDPLAEEGSSFQGFQIETAFFFTLEGGYYGGRIRSVPMSDSEAHRMLPKIQEDMLINVRYNPSNPDETHTLAADNTDTLPFVVWSS